MARFAGLPHHCLRSDSLRAVQTILVASDAPTLRREIEAVISGPDVTSMP